VVPTGRLLNHAISKPGGSFWAGAPSSGGMVPDGSCATCDVVRAMQQTGFEVRDVESLREIYSRTSTTGSQPRGELGPGRELVARPGQHLPCTWAASAKRFREGGWPSTRCSGHGRRRVQWHAANPRRMGLTTPFQPGPRQPGRPATQAGLIGAPAGYPAGPRPPMVRPTGRTRRPPRRGVGHPTGTPSSPPCSQRRDQGHLGQERHPELAGQRFPSGPKARSGGRRHR